MALSAQAVGRGADAVMFFQWRQSRAGSEKFHSAMLPQAGTDTRTWREVLDLGRWVQQLPALPVGARDADVAIIVDWENWWAIENPDHPVIIDYAEQIRIWYEAFHAQHVQIDFAPPTGDLAGYRLVVAPQLYLLTDGAAANLAGYVDGGGRLLVGAFSDVVDHHDHFRDGGFLTQLGDLLGIRLEDFGALGRAFGGPEPTVLINFDGATLTGHLLAEAIHLAGATAVAGFSGGPADGRPALTRAAYGQGIGYYLATLPDAAAAGRITAWLAEAAGVRPVLPGLPARVEVARRGEVLTLINHGSVPVTVSLSIRDLFTGAVVTDPSLEPYAVVLLREPRES